MWGGIPFMIASVMNKRRKSCGVNFSGWLLVPVRPVQTRASLSRARMPEIGIGRFSIPTGR